MKFKTVCIVGLGYIGLPTAALLASKKISVIGYDVNPQVIEKINDGKIHIVEPDLAELVKQVVNSGYLKASISPNQAEAFVIAVPTPVTKSNRVPNLSYVEDACRAIAPLLEPGNLVILESTSPVGTVEGITELLSDLRPDLTFPTTHYDDASIKIAYCPERVLPGNVLSELVLNDRIIGGLSRSCSETAMNFYRQFVIGDCLVTNARTAELVKITENSFRDVNIAFANELSMICDDVDVDVWELIRLANRHPRVEILKPGPGVGGHCIAVDPWFIVSKSPELARLIKTGREVNDKKPTWVFDKIISAIDELLVGNKKFSLSDLKIACYGLAFKANIDDLRESPAIQITKMLSEKFPNKILAVEPNIKTLPADLAEMVRLVNLQEAVETANLHVFLVEHNEFKSILRNKKLTEDVCVDAIGLLQYTSES